MTLKELIELLQELHALHGDVLVYVEDNEYGPCDLAYVRYASECEGHMPTNGVVIG
jgi:hypothetical protein